MVPSDWGRMIVSRMSLASQERKRRRQHKRALRKRARAKHRENLGWAARWGRRARWLKQQLTTVRRKRVGTFNRTMLNGHPGNVTSQCKRMIAAAHKWADQRGTYVLVTATTDGTHATNSNHYPSSPQNDGEHGNGVDIIAATVGLMEELQRWLEGRTPRGANDFRESFGPAAHYIKNGQAIEGHFPNHGDHYHGSPEPFYRR